MRKRVIFPGLPVWALLALLWSAAIACQSEAERLRIRKEAIDKEVANKLETFRKIKAQNCMEDVLTAASIIADSLIIVNARMQLDTTLKPPKPFKPDQPTIQTLIDSVPVKPLFKDSTKPRKDSTSKH